MLFPLQTNSVFDKSLGAGFSLLSFLQLHQWAPASQHQKGHHRPLLIAVIKTLTGLLLPGFINTEEMKLWQGRAMPGSKSVKQEDEQLTQSIL